MLCTILNAWEDQTWSFAITSPTTPHTPLLPTRTPETKKRVRKNHLPLRGRYQGAEPIAQWIHSVVAVRKGNSVQELRNCSAWRKGQSKSYSFNHYLQSQPNMHIGGTCQEDGVDSRAKQTGELWMEGLWGSTVKKFITLSVILTWGEVPSRNLEHTQKAPGDWSLNFLLIQLYSIKGIKGVGNNGVSDLWERVDIFLTFLTCNSNSVLSTINVVIHILRYAWLRYHLAVGLHYKVQ